MKKFLLSIVLLFSLTSFSQGKGKNKDNEPPIITSVSTEDGYVVSYGQSSIYVHMDAVDNVEVYQKIYQVDPCGPTYPAGPQMGKNCSYSGATDFWEVNWYYLNIQGLERGPHTLRYTVYDRARNET